MKKVFFVDGLDLVLIFCECYGYYFFVGYMVIGYFENLVGDFIFLL